MSTVPHVRGEPPAGAVGAGNLLDRVVSLEKAIGALQAQQYALLAEFAGHEPRAFEGVVWDQIRGSERHIVVMDAVREEVSAALRVPPSFAQARIDVARLLAGPLVGTSQALAEGRISEAHVRVLAEAADRLPGSDSIDPLPRGASAVMRAARRVEHARYCALLEQRVLPIAARGTAADTRRTVRRALHAIDPDGSSQRRRSARCSRDVWVTHDVDGISVLGARLASVDALAIMAAVERASTRGGTASVLPEGPEGASVGERRAAALVDLVLGSREDAEAGVVAPRVGVELQVTVDLPTLLALADEPVTLDGVGTLLVQDLREILRDPRLDVSLRRLVTDPRTGHLLDVAPHRYRLSAAMRRFIALRDRVCRFPTCRRKATRCQIDHAEPFDAGGPSTRANLGAACTRHHQLKTADFWHISHSEADGTAVWVSPSRRTYSHSPPLE